MRKNPSRLICGEAVQSLSGTGSAIEQIPNNKLHRPMKTTRGSHGVRGHRFVKSASILLQMRSCIGLRVDVAPIQRKLFLELAIVLQQAHGHRTPDVVSDSEPLTLR